MKTQAPARADVGRVLQASYAVFALAATGRSTLQLATRASEAPVPYALSALAGLIYIAGVVALWRVHSSERARRIAAIFCVIELTGVVAVGLFSVLVPTEFPHDTVWSGFGSGYGYIPVVLPLIALWWLRAGTRTSRGAAS